LNFEKKISRLGSRQKQKKKTTYEPQDLQLVLSNNQSLINRGRINFWISEDVLSKWGSTKKSPNAGRPEKYSDEAITAICMLRFLFHLSLRATEGFII